jgi:hypothetical protein
LATTTTIEIASQKALDSMVRISKVLIVNKLTVTLKADVSLDGILALALLQRANALESAALALSSRTLHIRGIDEYYQLQVPREANPSLSRQ